MNIQLLRDKFQMVRLTSWSRLINLAATSASFYFSKWTRSTQHGGMPVSIAIEPTTSCNLRCPECPSGLRSFSRATGMIDTALFENVISQLKNKISYLTFYFQGEPYLHKQFLQMVQHAVIKRIYTATSTNGHYLTPEMAEATVKSGLHRLIISIDGTTQEVYEQYRIGGDLNKVLQGAKNVIAAKRKLQSYTPHVIFQFLVVKPNQHQINEVQKIATEIGVDEVRFKTAQVYDFENGNPLIPTIEKYARYKQDPNGTYKIKSTLDDNCRKLWHSCVITWNGNVVPCCFDKDAKYVMGNVQQNNFESIWNNDAYKNFRQSLFASRKSIDICKNCTEGAQVWA